MSVNTRSRVPPDTIFTTSRMVTLLGSILVTLSSGTTYLYSVYAPQLGARLHVSNTQLNIVGLAGNMGVYISGPIWGRVVDHNGPRIPLIGASVSFLLGYLGIKKLYDDGIGTASTMSTLSFAFLVACGFITGTASNAGICAGVNTSAKSFPPSFRSTAIGLVMSGLGLSAFWFGLLSQALVPGDTSSFLLLLAIGTAAPMLIGLLTVKPIPLPSQAPTARDGARTQGYDDVPSADAISSAGDAQATSCSELDAESAPLLSQRVVDDDKHAFPNVHGKRLWFTSDFYLVFLIMGICCGTAIMYINNVGSISRALYANTHPIYDETEASKWQAAQVSILSLGNFAGRILIGMFSDFTYIRLRIPRAYCLCIVSFLFILSQATAIAVSSVETLWTATLLLGLAYGSLFGSLPTTVIEWFGMAHFSENWGFLSFAPVICGNLFSLIFGRNLDAHGSPAQDMGPSLVTSSGNGLPEHQCFDGRACYAASLQVTLVACLLALGLSVWAGIKDGQRLRRLHARMRE